MHAAQSCCNKEAVIIPVLNPMKVPDVGCGQEVCVQEAMIDMEQEFLNIGLDIIGLGVFNYDFGSISTESPVIKVRTAPSPGIGVLLH